MICEPLNPGHWQLRFAAPEAGFIIGVLARLVRFYQQDVAQMPPALRAYWQGNAVRGAAPDENRESQEVLSEARAELRSERLTLVENWLREFELAEERDPWTVEVTGAERDEFVAMLNDRRLALGLEFGITEVDMDMAPDQIADEARRQAIFEIDILGHFILITLGPQIYRP